MNVLIYALVVIGCYLLGSISPSIIISNSIAKKDIREFGSGNAGSTNMIRTFGWKIGLLTFSLDVLKGAISALICTHIANICMEGNQLIVMLGCFAAILGHGFPVYYKFRGGKGIASTIGIFLVLMTYPAMCIIAIAFLLILITKMVSIGSIFGMLLCAASSLLFTDSTAVKITIIILSLFTIFLHRENIRRIFSGTERKISFTRSKS